MRMRPSDLVVTAARLVIAGILLYAGFMKAAGPSAEFAALLETYKLFPSSFLSPLSLVVPYVEMWVGLFLLTGFYTRLSALAAALLFAGFIFAVGSALLRGIDLASCGCFGAESLAPRYTIVLDLFCLGLALTTVKLAKLPPPFSLDRAFP
jgi:uncharacterized membrane protein YphA (DoxX/SURF4 family)